MSDQTTGWQPIETAPRDGTPVLVTCGDPGARWVGEARFHADEAGWWQANTDPTDAHDGQCYPSYWMPLPEPPDA